MKTVPLTVLTLLGTSLMITACNDPMNMPPGKYEKTERSTDERGTTVEKKTSTDVEQDKNGNKKAIVESKTTKDPKGLLNKSTTSQSKKVIEEERDE